jgi:hypothetical protein
VSPLAKKVHEGRLDLHASSVINVATRLKIRLTDGGKAAAIINAMHQRDLAKLLAMTARAETKRGLVQARLDGAAAQKRVDQIKVERIKRDMPTSPGLSREASKAAALRIEERNDALCDLHGSSAEIARLEAKISRCAERASLIQACLERVRNVQARYG